MLRVTLLLFRLFPCCFGLFHQTKRVSHDYCNMEIFNATCRQDEVIIVESARYGRMSVGRCMHGVYGSQGCSADVFRFLDNRCSGRQVCRFQVPDPVMYETKPCPVDFTSYLEATFSCIKVVVGEKSTCDPGVSLKVSHSTGYLSTVVAEDRCFGCPHCPWVIEARPGQRINLTLFNFGTLSSSSLSSSSSGGGLLSLPGLPSGGPGFSAGERRLLVGGGEGYGGLSLRPDVCFAVAEVTDGADGKRPITVCGGDSRETSVFWSRSNVVQIEFPNPKLLNAIGAFVIRFRVTGCPDPRLSGDVWHQKSGDMLTVGCNATGQVWHLVCKGTRWIGDVGNCSLTGAGGDSWSLEQMFGADDAFPFGVLIAVAMGVAMGVIIGGTLLCVITMYMKRQRRSFQGYCQPHDQQVCSAAFSSSPASFQHHHQHHQHHHHVSSTWLTADTESVSLHGGSTDLHSAAAAAAASYRVTLSRESLGPPSTVAEDDGVCPGAAPAAAAAAAAVDDYGGFDGGAIGRPSLALAAGFKPRPLYYGSPCL